MSARDLFDYSIAAQWGHGWMAVTGHVDGMAGAHVLGWAVASPDTGNCAITITDAAGKVLAKGRASRHRPDLASLGVGRTTLAFRIAVEQYETSGTLHVLADGVELVGSPLKVGSGTFDGDAMIDRATITGWVTERVANFKPPLITVVNQHGTIVGKAMSTQDLAEIGSKVKPARFVIELEDRCFGCGELRLGIFANEVKIAERFCNLRLQGNLEVVTAEGGTGWLICPDLPQRVFEIDIFRDGVLAGTAICDISREDVRAVYPDCVTPAFGFTLPKTTGSTLDSSMISLRFRDSDLDLFRGPYVVGSRAAAVTAAHRAGRLAYRQLDGLGPAERAVIQLALSEFLASARRGDGFAAACQAPLAPPGGQPRLCIIIPVYRGVAVTRACIESVLAHRNPATDHIVLINDCSPDADMAPMLQSFAGTANLFLLTNETNIGFVKTVNRGLSFSLCCDILMLNSDTVMYAGGLNEICRVAYSAPDIGSVTALSNNATIFSYPHVALRSEALQDASWEQLAQIALAENAGVTIDIPTGHGFCLLIKGEVLRRIGFLDESFGRGYGEENDLCARASNLGYRHVLAAGALVLHRESISFVGEKASLLAANLPRLNGMYPEYTPVIMTFEDEDGIRRARWALDKDRLRKAAAQGTAFMLLVSNGLDGGTAKAVKEIEQAAGYLGGGKLTLRCQDNGFIELLCEKPEIWATFSPNETDELFDVLSAAAPTHVVVHQLLGFPAAFISRLGPWAASLHTVYYAHDFYPLCPRVTMIDAIGRFCDVADTDTCARCVKMGGAHEASKLTELSPAAHREMFGGLLRGLRYVVAPSASAAGYMERGFPGLKVQAVPHPERAEGIAAAARAGSDDEIVLLGAIGPHKGSAKLLEIAQRARLTHPNLKFRVIGFTNIDKALTAVGNVFITGRYKPEQLPGLIAKTKGRLAMFLSTWPETYSYTLSEAAKYGFIPLVPDIGAPAERVRAAKYGVVFPFPVEAAQVLETIDKVASGQLPAFGPGAVPGRLYPGQKHIDRTVRIMNLEQGKPLPASVG